MRSKEEASRLPFSSGPRPAAGGASTRRSSRQAKSALPELPDEKAARFVRDYGLSEYDAGVTASRALGGWSLRRHGAPRGARSQALRELG
jgi:aspartyl-tRNA(Asn)/glutamyl-tRNA(Gln) amidotransferase subunit B